MPSFQLKDKNSLYASYMPFVTNGGVFIPTQESYEMGQELIFSLTLMNEPEKFVIHGKVIWKTPSEANVYRTGIGVQFSPKDIEIKNKIETYLVDLLKSNRQTYTM